ncbi:MAG: homoserine kinase [Elusimicrobia bacterium]|nr:homoserine kinase [Elusimicrobiota bacterium]
MRTPRSIRVSVPATTSNLGPGFDTLGMALTLRMTLSLELPPSARGLAVGLEGEGADLEETGDNLVVRSFFAGLGPRRLAGRSPAVPRFMGVMGRRGPPALAFRIRSEIPAARGLGSSAAARLCGLLAAAALRGCRPADFERAVETAVSMEGHPDNAVPAAYGGLRSVLMDGPRALSVLWSVPRGLGVTVCVPDYEVSTPKARAVLPAKVPLKDAAANAARVAHLLGALRDGRLGDLRAAMRDALHQPYRAKLLPGFPEALRAAYAAGAAGAALSGSGSSVLAFVPVGRAQARVGAAFERAFARAGRRARSLTLGVDRRGACVETA